MKKKIRKEYGITLVALVITIIILLILAGISIQALTQTNLFNKAKQAKNATENAQKEENKILSEYMNKMNEYLPETLASKVNSGEVPIGSYIKYTPDVASEETINNLITELGTYSGSEANTKETLTQEMGLNWRVLDVKDGQVRLISDVPTTSTIALKGYNGYNNIVYLLDDICNKLYNNPKLTNKVQNLKIEDIQDEMIEKNYKNITSDYGEVFTPTNYKYYPSILLKEKEQQVNEKTGTELDLSEQKELIEPTSSNSIASLLKVKYTFWTKAMQANDFKDSKYYELFINNETNTYWLSSRCVIIVPEDYAKFYAYAVGNVGIGAGGLYNSRNYSIINKFSIRPVVTLNSNVQLDTTKAADGTQPSTAYEIK